jgi:hypothetical protein
MKQCSVLYIGTAKQRSDVPFHLRQYGLVVREHEAWPDDEQVLTGCEAVIVHVDALTGPCVAMRLRAKRRFGRRVLIGLVGREVTPSERLAAIAGGFDEILDHDAAARTLVACILRALRRRPEYRCRIPRRPAA